MESEIIPAIIPQSFEDLTKKVERVKDYVNRIQIDVFDGTYSPSVSWPYDKEHEDFQELKMGAVQLPYADDILFEVDVTLQDPVAHIEDWVKGGVRAVIVHIEKTENMDAVIAFCKEHSVLIGLALCPSTPNEMLSDWISDVDFIQCMGNDKVGYHGVMLDPRVFSKLEDLRSKNSQLPLSVDIGVTLETAPQLVKAGATRLVSGSAIYKSENVQETIESFRDILKGT